VRLKLNYFLKRLSETPFKKIIPFRELPLVFFYFDQLYSVMGGSALYYLGIYGYGADVSNDSWRATRFAIFDGMEMLGYMIGVFFSPKVFFQNIL